MKGILLFGHGARNPEWAQPFHRIREAILQREPAALVEPGATSAPVLALSRMTETGWTIRF